MHAKFAPRSARRTFEGGASGVHTPRDPPTAHKSTPREDASGADALLHCGGLRCGPGADALLRCGGPPGCSRAQVLLSCGWLGDGVAVGGRCGRWGEGGMPFSRGSRSPGGPSPQRGVSGATPFTAGPPGDPASECPGGTIRFDAPGAPPTAARLGGGSRTRLLLPRLTSPPRCGVGRGRRLKPYVPVWLAAPYHTRPPGLVKRGRVCLVGSTLLVSWSIDRLPRAEPLPQRLQRWW